MRMPLQDTAEYSGARCTLQLQPARSTAARTAESRKTEHHDLPHRSRFTAIRPRAHSRACGLPVCVEQSERRRSSSSSWTYEVYHGICISRLGKALCCCAPAPHVPVHSALQRRVAAVGGVLVARARSCAVVQRAALPGCTNTLHPAARRSPSTARLSRSLLSSTYLPSTPHPHPHPLTHRPIHTKGASTRKLRHTRGETTIASSARPNDLCSQVSRASNFTGSVFTGRAERRTHARRSPGRRASALPGQ